ncbi:MAG: restriction endonuclease subunit S [Candidatus Scalindua rubra]|uniref:Type I restriction modification DNA specificity domain-containing protein n=1 Tax=Candidatus Scalindua brodae TaxID=237368 RepID=A0A0B0EHB2_9BACT|nr:MAG: hypothetical protein SCABRO_02323 [Candidatus Scalindua brodae]MBZ0107193.1 restriction endonuclease subunit S [Candidatus Scalindua rubra]TWU31631.1 Type-1 restriction enzyme EcoKI specificity protein [Candidatus Brocadiaceae bacterium S225]
MMSEVNNMVNSWKYKRIGDMFNFVGGGTPSKKQTDFWNGDIFWASVKDVKGEFLDKTQNLITEKGLQNSASNIAEKGDVIIITRISPGKSIIANVRTAINQDLKIAKPKFKTTSKFIYYFFNSIERECINHSSGTTVLGITLNNLNELQIPDLSLPEQQAIVSKIEELLSDLENGKQQLQTAQQQLKVYRQSLLKWAFEGKLTNPPAGRAGKNVKEGELPKGWKLVKLGELFTNTPQNGLYKPSTQYGSGIPIIRIDGFYDGVILNNYDYKRVRLTEEEARKYLLSIDDILVNRVNSMSHLGKCGLVKSLKEPTVFESNVMKIQVKKKTALPKYITNYLSSSKGIKELTKNAKHAVNQASINQTDVSNAIIPVPTLEEQQIIVQDLESKLTVCDKIEETISQSLLQAESLRQSILKKAFEGKLIN